MAKQKGIGLRKQSEKPHTGTNHLLAIAIDDYVHVPQLYNCLKDANDLIAVLQEQYHFSKENTHTLFNKTATLSQITQLLEQLSKTITSEDSLLIYFSGHGYYKKTQHEGYLIPVDAEKDAYWNYLSNANLITLIRAIQSLHTLLIVDSCFSGSLFAPQKDGMSTVFEERMQHLPSRWALAAGMIEKVSDGLHGDNSPFAKAIITLLQRNPKSKLAVSELILHTQQATANNARQTPIGGPLYEVGDINGQFVFDKKEKRTIPTQITPQIPPKEKAIKPTPPLIHKTPQPLKTAKVFIDPRDGQQYTTRRLENGQRWMTQNLNYDVGEGCWHYENNPANGKKYGRLYNWKAVQKACPPGWHIPSNEEWSNLIGQYGQFLNTLDENEMDNKAQIDKTAYSSLTYGGKSGFDAQLGGILHDNVDADIPENEQEEYFGFIDIYGYYWSNSIAKIESMEMPFYYRFYRPRKRIERHQEIDLSITAYSCRCVEE